MGIISKIMTLSLVQRYTRLRLSSEAWSVRNKDIINISGEMRFMRATVGYTHWEQKKW